MRRLKLGELLTASLAFAGVSATTADSLLFVGEQTGIFIPPGSAYYLFPIAIWGLVGIPTSIALAERLLNIAYKKPGRVKRVVGGDTGRAIPVTANGQTSTIFASVQQSIFGNTPEDKPTPTATTDHWVVPVGEVNVTVTELSLTRFLEIASKRSKYQFSRNYWTCKRRPPMPLDYYNAYMRLLTDAGLVENRRSGASGYLVHGLKPRHAIAYLKHEMSA